jgi:hypothetical protein
MGNRKGLAQVLLDLGQSGLEIADTDLVAKRLEQARVELEALGEPLDRYLHLEASLALEMADLRSAQDLIARIRSGSEIPLRLEGSLLSERDHLEEARATLLETWKTGRQDVWGLGAALSACAVDCSGTQPAAGAACLANLRETNPNALPSFLAGCLVHEALCRYRMNDLTGAQQAAQDALEVQDLDDDSFVRILAGATSMRIAAARGEASKAIPALRGFLARTEAKHATLLSFEVALALGEAELRAGQPQGRIRLLKLEQDARSRECFRLSRLAREVLAGGAQLRAQTKR